MATPDWSGYLDGVWAWPVEFNSALPFLTAASNLVVGTNPPYTIQDFLGFYPKWGGVPLQQQITTVEGSPTVAVQDVSGMNVGNPVAGDGIPDGAMILSVDEIDETVTLSANATATSSTANFTVWNSPLVPFAMIQAYILLASSCLVQARWLSLWPFAMALYVAHFLTLYAQSENGKNITLARAAAQGLSTGIMVAKAVGDVSASYQPIGGLERWGAWNLTTFGQQLATFAKAVGSGPMLLY